METTPGNASPPPPGSTSSPIGIACLVLACLPYPLLIAALPDGTEIPGFGGGEATLGWGFQEFWAGVAGGSVLALLWLAIWWGARIDGLSGRGRRIAPFAAAGSMIALLGANNVNFALPDLWLSVATGALPVPIACLALKVCLPAQARRLSGLPVDQAALGLTVALSLAVVPLMIHASAVFPARKAQYLAALEAERVAAEAEGKRRDATTRGEFARLGPGSSLGDYFLPQFSTLDRSEVLAGARLVKSRQADAIAMLMAGRIDDLADLLRLDLEPTPALCGAWRTAFAQRFDRAGLEDDYFLSSVEHQVPSMRWLLGEHCDLSAAVGLIEVRLRSLLERQPLTQLAHLADMDPAPGPVVCAAYNEALAKDLARAETGMGGIYLYELDRQMPNMTWLHDAGCNLNAAINVVEGQLYAMLDGPGWEPAAGDPDASNSVWAVRRGRLVETLGTLAALRVRQ